MTTTTKNADDHEDDGLVLMQQKEALPVPIRRPSLKKRQNVFFTQLHHHRENRRHRRQLFRRQSNDGIHLDDRHRAFFQWRRKLVGVDASNNNSTNSTSSSSTLTPTAPAPSSSNNTTNTTFPSTINTKAQVAAMNVSNCHLLLYTGEIGIGTPIGRQTFTVALDTGNADTWVISDHCDDTTCEPHWRKYNSNMSNTYSTVMSTDPLDTENTYWVEYFDGEFIYGRHAQDVVHLAPQLDIPQQIFAEITTFEKLEVCDGQEGLLGLGNSDLDLFDYPSVLSNLKSTIPHPIFSMYLDKRDDYNDDDNSKQKYQPLAAHSEIIFGGVHHIHYRDCLTWHDAADMSLYGVPYWALSLKAVHLGDDHDTNISPYGDIAVIDSASSFVIGPAHAVSRFIDANDGIECFILDAFGDAKPISCDDEWGFDAAAINCSTELVPLQFHVDDKIYEIGSAELFMKVDDDDEICFLRIAGEEELPGWILGDIFLDRYYAVFNFVDQTIGLAENSANDPGSICPDDWPLDIDYDGKPAPPTTPTPSRAPISRAPTIPTTKSQQSATSSSTPRPHAVPAPKVPTVSSSPKIGTGSSAFVKAKKGGHKAEEATAAVSGAVLVVLGAILMVSVLSAAWRRRHYSSLRHNDAVSADDDDMGGEMELPALT